MSEIQKRPDRPGKWFKFGVGAGVIFAVAVVAVWLTPVLLPARSTLEAALNNSVETKGAFDGDRNKLSNLLRPMPPRPAVVPTPGRGPAPVKSLPAWELASVSENNFENAIVKAMDTQLKKVSDTPSAGVDEKSWSDSKTEYAALIDTSALNASQPISTEAEAVVKIVNADALAMIDASRDLVAAQQEAALAAATSTGDQSFTRTLAYILIVILALGAEAFWSHLVWDDHRPAPEIVKPQPHDDGRELAGLKSDLAACRKELKDKEDENRRLADEAATRRQAGPII